MKNFPFFRQPNTKDCGPTCLKIIGKYFKRDLSLNFLREKSECTRSGSSLQALSDTAETIGFKTLCVKISLNDIIEAPLPSILHWNKSHYVVLYKIKRKTFYISDPAHGLLKYNKSDFLKGWIDDKADDDLEDGIAMLIEPSMKFYQEDNATENQKVDFSFISKYILKYKAFIWQLVISLFAGSLLQLILPFLTQSIVDIGIKNKDLNFIYLILFAQLALFIGKIAVESIRGWILLHLSTRINISLISDFFVKLMSLPISYFDTRMTGDILQRIADHDRIERILTTSSLTVVFSLVNLLVFGVVLGYYNFQILAIFLIGSVIYFFWILIFLKKRRDLDYKRFSQNSKEHSKVIELVNGMQTIKLNNAEKKKRWEWEFIQAKLFKISIEGLVLEQYQNIGSSFLNELKNIIITILAAKLVVEGEITLGMMLAITYIVGQLNSPITQLINFIREFQDAKISLERVSEIHNIEDEEHSLSDKIFDFSTTSDLILQNVCFRYIGSNSPVLNNIDFIIPAKSITAIVGASGSGKTTLIKILLKFYESSSGKIKLGSHDLRNISQRSWRNNCGVVMQEDYIFNDTIANNIAISDDIVDKEKLKHAVEVANIKSFIEELPLTYKTKIGAEGAGLSTGQKQRLLIARAVYKNPNYLFFDEATSALDANNEKIIMKNLNQFFINKTVIIVAHRLSTVKNADQIIVLDNGNIVEVGNHQELTSKRGSYYHLVKNQLELGK